MNTEHGNDSTAAAARAAAAPARLDAGLALEAGFALALSALLCLNAWPWIAGHARTVAGSGAEAAAVQTSAVLAAVMLYGLAWPAIAAAIMGATRWALGALARPTRLVIVCTLLALTLAALAGRGLAWLSGAG